MTDPTHDPRVPRPGDGFEMLLREQLHQLADHAPTTVHSLDDIRVQHHTGRAGLGRERREGRHRRTAGIGASIAALVGAVGFTAVALTGAGTAGAASPEAAVRAFLEATAEEDILGMIDALDPAEVPAARAGSEQGRAEAVDADLLSEGFSLDGLDGFDVAFDQLDLVTETLADGLAVVNVAAGSTTWTFDPATFPLGEQLQEAFGDDLAVTTDGADLLDLVSPAMLATVERDGRWYVSVSYTLAEYARQSADLAMPDTQLTAVGADSPEAAADEFFSNLVSLDLAGALATAAPGEGDALLRYAPLLIDGLADGIASWTADGFDLQLSDTSYVVEGDGSRRTLVAERFTIRGTIPEPETYGYFDPTLPTIIWSADGMGAVVLDAGVALPATVEGLDFDPDFQYPDGMTNSTWANPDGTVSPLPEKPVSDGPDTFEIARADGCTTWSGQGAVSTFGPVDAMMGWSDVGPSETQAVEAVTDDDIAIGSDGTSSSNEVTGEASTFGDVLGYEQIDDDSWRSCSPSTGGIGLFALLSTSGLADLPPLEVVEVDGQWYVSPIGSVASIVVDLVSSVREAGSLLDSQIAPFVVGTDRNSLEMIFVGQPAESFTPECQLLVTTDGSTVTGLVSDDLDLGDVRACMTSNVHLDSGLTDAVPLPVEEVPAPLATRVEVPATSVAP